MSTAAASQTADAVFGKDQIAYAAVAALTWMVWDTIIHWNVEVDCIWRRPTSWVKYAYVFIRYVPILHGGAVSTLNRPIQFSTAGCRAWVYWELIFIELLTLTVEVVLVARLYVLYNHNKIVLWAMMFFFLAEVAVMVTALIVALPKLFFNSSCLVFGSPGFFMAYWLSSLLFETFLFVLTLIKFFQSARRIFGKQSIMVVFVRDGTWAFAIIFVVMTLNLFLYKLSKTWLAGMGYYWVLSVMSFAGSHVLLNLRRLGTPSYESTISLGTLQFGGTIPHVTLTTMEQNSHVVETNP